MELCFVCMEGILFTQSCVLLKITNKISDQKSIQMYQN